VSEIVSPEFAVWVDATARRMGESAMSLTLFTEEYGKHASELMQFALAVIMDKPLYLLVPNGRIVPEKIKKIADGIEFFEFGNKESMYAATVKLMSRATQKNLSA
jgi:hypothetical protein